MKWSGLEDICFIFVILITQFIRRTRSSGTFEMHLLSYKMDEQRDERGFCCSDSKDLKGSTTASCSQKCSLLFRVCLKQYQSVISTGDRQNCTYGSRLLANRQNNDSGTVVDQQPLLFPFPFAWIDDLTVIIEVWHAPHGYVEENVNKNAQKASQVQRSPRRQLLMRIAQRKSVAVGQKWTFETHSNANSKLELQFRVMCDEHYYGSQCADYCKPRDDAFGHFYCSTSGRKICMDGWTGSICSIAKCLPGCHPEHGTCSRPNECVCRLGYVGQFCDKCMRYPGCQHGTCKEPYECNCDEGWGGLFCNQDLNYCTHHKPCLNGATCTNTGAGHYTCSCRLGYTGVNCGVKIANCSLEPCFNGATCRESGTNYTCLCPAGYSGKHCQTLASTCADKPCENGASCMSDGASGYKCLCAPGWQGVNCDIEVDMCQSSPCINGGSCVSHFGSFNCLCPTGYVGDRCEINRNDCSAQSCLNGGTCVDEVDNFKCVCKAGFFGTLCQFNVDDCIKRPCANGGTCFDLVNDYKCECRPGFRGKDCSVDINECDSNPCRFGATCEDLVNDYACHCLPCYFGKDCRQRDDNCLLRHDGVFDAMPAAKSPPNTIEVESKKRPGKIVNFPLNSNSEYVDSIGPYQSDFFSSRSMLTSQDDSRATAAIDANLPLVVGVPLVVIFVIIMIALIVIILCLLRRYKNVLPAVCGGGVDEEAAAACRDNVRNTRIAAMAAKQSKSRSVKSDVIYNNNTRSDMKNLENCKDNNRFSVIATYDSKKSFAAVGDQSDGDYAASTQYYEQKAKNLNVIPSANTDDQTANSKVYKIVSMEKLQPAAKHNNGLEGVPYDVIDDAYHGQRQIGTTGVFCHPSDDKTTYNVDNNSDKGYATTSLSVRQSPRDLPVLPANDDRGALMTIGQMSPMRTENLRATPLLPYSSLHPIHRHNGHAKIMSSALYNNDPNGV